MAVVFDEVVGTVEPERGVAAEDTTSSAESGAAGCCDVAQIRRAVERIAVRRARLFAD
ncbi:hypothetical protein [Longimicrobium sp.]|uniref:hypothetical protein n=1 Tax=Longimicrobium sp. TaxID=2029185 RepID=UPI002E3660CD|nr:hypothetical protein [Longimicrobium sp.]HEX6036945.1 hypothetical protein [Longimicrobium sp.]